MGPGRPSSYTEQVRARSLLLASLLPCFTACGDGLEPLDLPEGCQPLLGPAECLLPYPSDFFVEDGLVVTRGAAKLFGDERQRADVGSFKPIRGFSRLPAIVAHFGQAVAAERLVPVLGDLGRSVDAAASPTLLLEAESGRPVPHFADLDPLAESDARRALIIQPLVSLEAGARYVVAIAGLTAPDGALLEAPEGFRRLRDGQTRDPALRALGERYERDVFPVLERAGLARAALQLAWDFTTGRDEDALADMLRVRSLTLAALAASPPRVTVESVEEPEESRNIWRIVKGTVTAPLFLESARPGVGAQLLRDARGEVKREGELEVPFTAMVPLSLKDRAGPARALFYGHGFFGSQRELTHSAPIEIANRLDLVLFGVDWWGMTARDRALVVERLALEPAKALEFADGVHQAMANWLAFGAAVRDAMTREPALHRQGAAGPELLYDPAAPSFLGISQGHILGGVLAALDPNLEQVALNAGGAAFTQMMFRARPFNPFLEFLGYSIADPLRQQAWVATLQRHFDPIDPAIWARYILEAPLPGSAPDRRVLLQVGVGDAEVPTISGFLHARLLGAGLTTPSAAEVFGLEPHQSQRAALTVFDLGTSNIFTAERRPPLFPNRVHEGVRRLQTAQRQMDRFFGSGVLEHPCDGPCRPE